MIEEYLQKLQQTLLANHYDDVENAIDYIMECIEDKKEEGCSEQEILDAFGTVEAMASSITGKQVKPAITSYAIKHIITELTNTDLEITESECFNVEVNYPDNGNYDVHEEGDTLYIKEKKTGRSFFSFSRKIIISLPKDYPLSTLKITAATSDTLLYHIFVSDVQIQADCGDLHMEDCFLSHVDITARSGDLEIEKGSLEQGTLHTASGDIHMEDCSLGTVSITAASGDVSIEESDLLHLDISTHSGDIELDLPCEEEQYTIHKNHETTGTGSKQITLKTASGDIDIDFAY